MKSCKDTFEKIISDDNIVTAFRKASLGKRDRSDVKAVFENFDFCIKEIRQMLINGTFKPIIHPECAIVDGATKKIRHIVKPRFYPEQIIHHCLIEVLAPNLMGTAYYYSMGSIPDKGAQLGAKRIKEIVRTDEENTQYVFKCDIHHFFQSIDKDILYQKLDRRFGKDKRTMELIHSIIYNHPYEGLPLGYYPSQWFANFYLEDFDNFIKQELKVKHYFRYMDDMVFFGKTAAEMHEVKNKVFEYLEKNLKLRIKDNWQVFRFNYYDEIDGKWKGRDLDFLGYRFFRYKTILRKHIMCGASKLARKIAKQGPNCHNAAGMISYMGWINDTDSYNFYVTHIKPYVQINRLRKIVSKDGKRRAKRAKFRLELRERQLAEQTERDRLDAKSKLRLSA